jgi:hypothetical protein
MYITVLVIESHARFIRPSTSNLQCCTIYTNISVLTLCSLSLGSRRRLVFWGRYLGIITGCTPGALLLSLFPILMACPHQVPPTFMLSPSVALFCPRRNSTSLSAPDYPVRVAPRLSRLVSPPLLDLTILSAPHYSMGLDYSHGCTLILWSAPRLDSNQPGQNTGGTTRLGSIVAATRCHGLLRHGTALTTSY